VRFTDEVPEPIYGLLGGCRVALHVWPGEAIPSHGEAFMPRNGPLAGLWVLVRFLDVPPSDCVDLLAFQVV